MPLQLQIHFCEYDYFMIKIYVSIYSSAESCTLHMNIYLICNFSDFFEFLVTIIEQDL